MPSAKPTLGPYLVIIAGLAAEACAQPCTPRWDPAFIGNNPDHGVHALAAIPTPAAPVLYVGGKFQAIGGVPFSLVAAYSGTAWAPLGTGIPFSFNSHGFMGCCAHVKSFAASVSGAEPGVFIAGDFVQIDSTLFESVGRFSAGAWTPLAGGMALAGCVDCALRVNSLQPFGGMMHAAGGFTHAGGVAAANAARWTGSAWEPLGTGLGASPTDEQDTWVEALTVYTESGVPRLFAAGRFSRAGSVITNCVARWDGAAWTDVGGGVGFDPQGPVPVVKAMAVLDEAGGPALYIAGSFDAVGGVPARNIARWNGAQWSALGTGVGTGPNDQVFALAAFDDGRGPALYAAGVFEQAGGIAASNIARWSGSAWEPLGAGTDGEVQALAAYEHLGQRFLYVGGFYATAGGLATPNLARWAACAPDCYPNCDGSTQAPVLNVSDFGCFLTRYAAGEPYANCDGSTQPPVLNVQDFGCFLTRYAAGCP
ncbi:MAG: GC-type dockerin domain-anchored protein [Phycisphaerales bacterium]